MLDDFGVPAIRKAASSAVRSLPATRRCVACPALYQGTIHTIHGLIVAKTSRNLEMSHEYRKVHLWFLFVLGQGVQLQ